MEPNPWICGSCRNESTDRHRCACGAPKPSHPHLMDTPSDPLDSLIADLGTEARRIQLAHDGRGVASLSYWHGFEHGLRYAAEVLRRKGSKS